MPYGRDEPVQMVGHAKTSPLEARTRKSVGYPFLDTNVASVVVQGICGGSRSPSGKEGSWRIRSNSLLICRIGGCVRDMLSPHRCAPSLTRPPSSAWPTWPPRSMLFTYCIARVSTSDCGKERKCSSLPARGLRRTRSPPNISFIGTVYGAMDILYWYTDLNVSLYIRHSGSSIAKSSNDEAEVAVEVIVTFARGVSIDTG